MSHGPLSIHGVRLARLIPAEIVAEGQMNDIISSVDAWTISEDMPDEEVSSSGLKPTVSARQVKALIEQLTGTCCLLMSNLLHPSGRNQT